LAPGISTFDTTAADDGAHPALLYAPHQFVRSTHLLDVNASPESESDTFAHDAPSGDLSESVLAFVATGAFQLMPGGIATAGAASRQAAAAKESFDGMPLSI
jgi:hypothetical protein